MKCITIGYAVVLMILVSLVGGLILPQSVGKYIVGGINLILLLWWLAGWFVRCDDYVFMSINPRSTQQREQTIQEEAQPMQIQRQYSQIPPQFMPRQPTGRILPGQTPYASMPSVPPASTN